MRMNLHRLQRKRWQRKRWQRKHSKPWWLALVLGVMLPVASCATSSEMNDLDHRLQTLEREEAERGKARQRRLNGGVATGDVDTVLERQTIELVTLRADVALLRGRLAKLESAAAAEARPRRPAKAAQNTPYILPLDGSIVRGNVTAKNGEAVVDVVVFTDFQCPFCARVHSLLDEVLADPELNGRVRVIYKHFPLSFHKDARPTAKAALAIAEQGEDRYWNFIQYAYDHQRELTSENFSKWAAAVGADVARFERALRENDQAYDAQIRKDLRLGQYTANVRGTPSIFVGGWELRQRSVDGVKALVREKQLLGSAKR